MAKLEVVRLASHEQQYDAEIVRLLNEYAQIPIIHGKPLPAEVLERMLPGLREHGGLLFVALDRSEVVGVATVLPGYSTFYARPLLNVHDLVVAAEHQGRGIGTMLLEAVEAHARQLACCKVTLEVLATNPRAHALYERFGYDQESDGTKLPTTYFLQKVMVDSTDSTES